MVRCEGIQRGVINGAELTEETCEIQQQRSPEDGRYSGQKRLEKKRLRADSPPKTVSLSFAPAGVIPAESVMSGPAIRKKDLVDRVTACSGVMKKDLNRLSKQFWLN